MSSEEKTDDSSYKWNDLVQIKKNAPLHPGEVGVVCGFSKIEFEEIAIKYHGKVGCWLYTVEFSDGTDVLVSEKYLERYQDP